jgi:hypothetical protein
MLRRTAIVLILFLGGSVSAEPFPLEASELKAFSQNTDKTDIELPALLDSLAEYCRTLEGAALDFVCLEKIVEIFDPKLDVKPPVEYPLENLVNLTNIDRLKALSIRYPPKKDSYLYDYQCIRKNGILTERRTLLKENGRKRNEPDAELKTSVVQYQNILLGPVGIFSSRNQPLYDYEMVGRSRMRRGAVVIVEAVPIRDTPSSNVLFGKAWIDPAGADILKIEWSPKRVGHFERFRRRGEDYGLEPSLTLTSEFEIAKNGLRFPTRFIAQEAYMAKSGRSFTRSTTTVHYTDFKFFTVEVEIK